MGSARSHRGVASQARRPGVGALFVAIAVGSMLAGCAVAAAPGPETARHSANSSKYGSLPGFLPHQSFDTDRVLVGTVTRPALTTEGDAVTFGAGSSAARVTVSGPEVPGEGLPYQSAATTCTWTVTIHAGSRAVPIAAADFSTIDHLGTVYQPSFVPGQATPPTILAAHGSATFELRALMLVGEGLMRWAPDGTHTVAQWDFEVEND
jgi:hypothetical protein